MIKNMIILFNFLVLKFDKSKYFKPVELVNIYWKVVTLEVLKLDKLIEVNLGQLLNADLILVTDEVFIFPKFMFSKFEQLRNIDCIDDILDVSNVDKSIELIFELWSNKWVISLTEEVFIFPKIIVSKFVHLWNIYFIDVTLDVSNKDISIELIFVQLQNK